MHPILTEINDKVRAKLNPSASLSHTFAGECGLAQSILYFALEDIQIKFNPIATQSLSNFYFGHAAGSAILHDNDVFLIDPTFVQFDSNQTKAALTPFQILQKTQTGAALLENLIKYGHSVMTPQTASLYLESFMNGKALEMIEDEAFEFIKNPPAHEYHLVYNSNNQVATRQLYKSSQYKL